MSVGAISAPAARDGRLRDVTTSYSPLGVAARVGAPASAMTMLRADPNVTDWARRRMRCSEKDASGHSTDDTRSSASPTREGLTALPHGHVEGLRPIIAAAIAALLHVSCAAWISNHGAAPRESSSPPRGCLPLDGGLIPKRFIRRHTVMGWIANCRAACV